MFEGFNIFNPEGAAWFQIFKQQYQSLEPRFIELNGLYDLTNQPYDFNSKIFSVTNPI